MSKTKSIFTSQKLEVTIHRLVHEIVEHAMLTTAPIGLIGIQPRGVFLSERIKGILLKDYPDFEFKYGILDTSFYRDDYQNKNEIILPNITDIDFSIDDMHIILIDDVFYTGRTIRAAMEAIVDFGRPKKVELLTLIDRRLNRDYPIVPDYVGMHVDSVQTQKVKVQWKEQGGKDEVLML